MERTEWSGNHFVLEIPSKPENVAFVRQTVAIFAAQLDFTIDEIDEIKVAVSEVVSMRSSTDTRMGRGSCESSADREWTTIGDGLGQRRWHRGRGVGDTTDAHDAARRAHGPRPRLRPGVHG